MAAIPIPRDPELDLSAVPRHWYANSPVGTAIANGLNMLFPAGERFFVRSVRHYLDDITDPTLRAQVKAFFKQEGHHAHAHDELNDVVRGHGFEIDKFLAVYQKLQGWVDRASPPALRLAVTAAAEHFTAIMAEGAFEHGALDGLHPQMQHLLAWHAAEEIEHKAVAFDVLRAVNPSYALRMAGLGLGTVLLASFWVAATVNLLRQERLPARVVRAQLRRSEKKDPVLTRVFLRGIKQYIRRDFHPSDNHDEHKAQAWFAAHGMPFVSPEAEAA